MADDSRRRHGAQSINESMLYAALAKLRTTGLIVECAASEPNAEAAGPARGPRYCVTSHGQAMARAEIERLARLVDDCRAVGF